MERSWKTQLQINNNIRGKLKPNISTLRVSAAGLMVLANCIHQEWVSVCVTAGTRISVYFLISRVRKRASEHERALIKHEIICDQHQSKSLFFLSVAYRPLIIHSCLLAPRRKFGKSIFSMHSNTHIPMMFGKKKNPSLHSMEICSQLYEEWHSLDVERCHMRKTLWPHRQRRAQQQNPNDSNLNN